MIELQVFIIHIRYLFIFLGIFGSPYALVYNLSSILSRSFDTLTPSPEPRATTIKLSNGRRLLGSVRFGETPNTLCYIYYGIMDGGHLVYCNKYNYTSNYTV